MDKQLVIVVIVFLSMLFFNFKVIPCFIEKSYYIKKQKKDECIWRGK